MALVRDLGIFKYGINIRKSILAFYISIFTWDMLIIPTARVLNPKMVRFLYFFLRWSMMCKRFPSRFKKCGYFNKKTVVCYKIFVTCLWNMATMINSLQKIAYNILKCNLNLIKTLLVINRFRVLVSKVACIRKLTWRENMSSNSVSSRPLDGRTISFDLNIRFELWNNKFNTVIYVLCLYVNMFYYVYCILKCC